MSDTRNPPAFTKGPWKYGHLGTEVLWIGPDYNQTPVAHIDHDMEYARDNSRANAALIAAAPELYEALMAILAAERHSLHVGYDNGTGGGNYVYADVVRLDDEAFDKARAALAKARGEG
jgi:hypothetical protein